jgi:hypothetical protein
MSGLYERDFCARSSQQAAPDNPSLKARLAEALASAYRTARRDAAIETGLPLATFPPACPWTFEQAMRDAA